MKINNKSYFKYRVMVCEIVLCLLKKLICDNMYHIKILFLTLAQMRVTLGFVLVSSNVVVIHC